MDAETLRISRKRGPYNPRTVAGTIYDKRIKQNADKRKKVVRKPRSHPELDGVQANEMVGENVDPGIITMKDLATKLMSEGRVSQRGVRLHAFQREEEGRKRTQRNEKMEETWRRKQIQRRKLRAELNVDRARRREEAGTMGDDEDEISIDSEDSEETFEPMPDRMTPPSSPGPPGRVSHTRVAHDQDSEVENGDQDEVEPVNEEEEEDADRQVDEEPQADAEVAPPVEEDEADAELQAAGFTIADIPRPAAGDDQEEEEDQESIDWDSHQPDIEALRAERDEERRRVREAMGERVVEEQDDETTMVNSITFSRRHGSSEKWTKEETEFFYMVSCYTMCRAGY